MDCRKGRVLFRKQPPIQIRLQQSLGVVLLFQRSELLDALLAGKSGDGGRVQKAVFGEVEPAPSLYDQRVHFGGEADECASIGGGQGEVQREGVAVDGVRHQEVVRAVALEDAEVGRQAVMLRKAYLFGEDGQGVLGRHEALVLDEAVRLVAEFPVGDVIEQKREAGVSLAVLGFVA